MEESVIISIKGNQASEDGQDEMVEFVTRGALRFAGEDEMYLSYEESELTGLEGTQTTFHIRPGGITLMRTGNLSSHMVFEEGERHLSVYDTGLVELAVGVQTQLARADIGATGGSLELMYVVDIENSVVGTNRVQIAVKRQGANQEEE